MSIHYRDGKSGKPAHAMRGDAGAVDSQGTSQNSLQRAKRKARDAAGVAGRGKRPSRAHEDALMSQMGCSQQVTFLSASHFIFTLTGMPCADCMQNLNVNFA